MVDTDTAIPASDSIEPDGSGAAPQEPGSERNRVRIVGLILIILLAVALVLLIRGCDGAPESSSSSSFEIIESQPGVEPIRGAVSVWVVEGASIDVVLQSAGVASRETVDLGEGRYVVSVNEGTELEVARALAEVAGVQDAGFVYEDDQLEVPDQP